MHVRSLVTGETLAIGDGEVVQVGEVEQRNWSRVASASPLGSEGPAYFLKQFVAADGEVSAQGLADELRAASLGREVIGADVIVPAFDVESRALLVYPFERFTATDRLLREEPQQLYAVWDAFCADLRVVIEACVRPDPAQLEGLRDRRAGDGAPRALAFKALEVRNIAPAIPAVQPLRIFDLGPPYVATAPEIAARLLVSVLLLNWGRPMSGFWRGPATDLAECAAAAWSPYVAREVVLAELSKETRMRARSVQATSSLQRAAKAAGLATVGRRYAAHARRWVRTTLS
jgi:hypothetical protein